MESLPDFPPDWRPIRYVFHHLLTSPLSSWNVEGLKLGDSLFPFSHHVWKTLQKDGTIYIPPPEDSNIDHCESGNKIWGYFIKPGHMAAMDYWVEASFSKYICDDVETLMRELSELVTNRYIQLSARRSNPLSQPLLLPSDVWTSADINDWQKGSLSINWEPFFSLHFRDTPLDTEDVKQPPALPRSVGKPSRADLVTSILETFPQGTLQAAPMKVLQAKLEPEWASRHPDVPLPSEKTIATARSAVRPGPGESAG